MKKLLLSIFAISFCSIAIAHTIDWYVDGSVYTTTNCSSGDNVTPPTAPTKYGYAFLGWTNFKLIEYLQSTGTQYINVGIVPTQNTYVEMDFQYTTTSILSGQTAVSNAINGCRSSGLTDRFYPVALNDFDGLRYTYGSTELTSSNPLARHYVKFNDSNHDVYVDNVLIGNLPTNTYVTPTNSPRNFWLFAGNNEMNQHFYSAIKIYSFQLYENGTLVRDMIPVLDPYGVPCMYDKVSEQFFYNAGTGNFVAGPVISE